MTIGNHSCRSISTFSGILVILDIIAAVFIQRVYGDDIMVINIGGFTADYLLIKNGQPDLSVCGSLEDGVIVLYNHITARVNSGLDMLLDESDIDAILKSDANSFGNDVTGIVNSAAQAFISDLFGKLRERAIDLRSSKAVFVGGGSILLRKQIEASGKIAHPIFVNNISANAKGYELLYRANKASV